MRYPFIDILAVTATFCSLCSFYSLPALAQHHNHNDHSDHNHAPSGAGAIIIDHKLNPSAFGFKPADFVNDLFDEYSIRGNSQRSISLDGLVQLYQDMRIIPSSSSSSADSHEGHDHYRRDGMGAVLSRRQTANSSTGDSGGSDNCLLPIDLLTIYGLNITQGLNRTSLERIAPALVYVSSANLCKSKTFQFSTSPSTTNGKEKRQLSNGLVWLSSFVAITIVTLACMFGLGFTPFLRRSAVVADIFLSFSIALGVGTLVSDAMLHLLPSLLGIHAHDHAKDGGDAHDNS
ncbi:hypothetical protein HDV05_006864, partial [Chytridiales sp. JEL 0842]